VKYKWWLNSLCHLFRCLWLIVRFLMQWFSMKRQHAIIVMADSLYYSKFKTYCQVQFLNTVSLKILSNFFYLSILNILLIFFELAWSSNQASLSISLLGSNTFSLIMCLWHMVYMKCCFRQYMFSAVNSFSTNNCTNRKIG